MKKRTLPILLLLAGISATALAACGHEHTYGWKNSADGKTHWQECECGEKINEGAHTDADTDGKCDVCEADVHVHSYEWKSNATKHWQECECEDKIGEGDHADEDSDGKCDVCEADVHVHTYEWQSDATKHWQECECEDKISEGDHADEDSDGKCDACARDYFAVSFAMRGHGTAPEAQKIISGGLAVAPETPADDDAYKFKGWFKDTACTEAFDFGKDTIEKATTIYAKWEEDTTAGASKKYAYKLTIEEESLKEVKSGAVVYYVYSAENSGRYTVSLGAGVNSQNSTFTTTLTGDTVFGKDQSTDSVTFDMDVKQTVYIKFTYLGEDGEDVTAGVMIGETLDEPLPEDRFPDGEYYNEIYSLEIDRENKTVTYEGVTYPFRYIAGKFDRISYVVTIGSESTTFYLSAGADGSYAFTNSGSSGSGSKLEHFEPQDPVALSAVFGYYKPKEEATDGITELYIYESGSPTATSVRFKQNGVYADMKSAVYDTAKNRLTFDGYTVTLNLADDGSVESIRVGTKTYKRIGDTVAVPPAKLPVEENAEYFGTTHTVRTPSGSQYFGAEGTNTMIVMEYAEDTGKYTVLVISNTETYYQLTVSDDKKTIVLFDAKGVQLDTLTKFEYIYHELPAEETEISIAASDFQKDLVYLFTVKTEGWYSFTGIQSDVAIYYNLNPNDPMLDYENGSAIENGIAVRLAENATVGVFMGTPAATKFTVAPAEDPAGHSEDNPKSLAGGSATINDIVTGTTYYFEYTATEAGSLAFNAFYDNGNADNSDFVIGYTIDGKAYNFGYSAKDAITRVAATAGQTFKINVTVGEYMFSKSSITVAVVEDFSFGASEIKMTGTPESDSLTVSATAASGSNYYIASTKGGSVTVTGSAAFTIKMQSGASVKAEEKGGVFTATISAGERVYFKVVSETQQNVTFSQTFAKGSQGYPVTASAEDGENTVTLQNGETVFIALSAGKYVFKAPNYTLTVGNAAISVNTIVEIKAGDLLFFDYRYGDSDSATLTILPAEEIFTKDQAGLYKDESGNVTLELTTYNCAVYTVKNGPYQLGGNVAIVAETDGTYTFAYTDESDWVNPVEVTVTFTFVDGKISVTDTAVNGGEAFEIAKEAVGDSVTYTGVSTSRGDPIGVTLVLNADMTAGTYSGDGEGPYEITINQEDGVYYFEWGTYGDSASFTVGADGTEISINDSFLGTFTLSLPNSGTAYTGICTSRGDPIAVTLVLNGDMTAGTYSGDGDGPYEITIHQEDGAYYFEWGTYGDSASFTVSEDGTTITIVDSFLDTVALTKQA